MTPIYAGQTEPKERIDMTTGQDFLDLAATRIGADYVFGVEVDLNDPNWGMPGSDQSWDCAEFISWLAKQLTGKLYGCIQEVGQRPDPWTGAWYRDAKAGTVKIIPLETAYKTPGAILLRYEEGMHHIVASDGKGGTIEAKGAAWGVCRGQVAGRLWTMGILIPGIQYEGRA